MKVGKWMKVIFGLLLIVSGLYSYTIWLPELIQFIKGGLGLVLVVVGLLVMAIGSVE